MIILVCGDRNWADREVIDRMMDAMPADTVVVEGEARGADSMARDSARARGLRVLRFPALWDKYGRRAGHIRNQQMLDEGHPDLVVYCHDNLDESKGTKDMVNRAHKAGIAVRNVREWDA